MCRSSQETARNNRVTDVMAQSVAYPDLVCTVLRARFGMLRGAEKRLARLAGVSPRTVANWLQANCAPQGEQLLTLMAECDDLALAILAEVARRRRDGGPR